MECWGVGVERVKAYRRDTSRPHLPKNKTETTMAEPLEQLELLEGHWAGTCKTWFQPDVLADTSDIEGTITKLPYGPFYRHEYRSQMKGKPRAGEEMFAFNKASGLFEVTWVDDFHMNYGILISTGKVVEEDEGGFGFFVKAKYSIGEEHPEWGWNTHYKIKDDGVLEVVAYNVTPDGESAKAVEIIYKRKP